MLLNNVYSVKVIENPLIKYFKNGKHTLYSSDEKNNYEAYLIKIDENTFADFDNNKQYTYCKNTDEYIQKNLFLTAKAIVTDVSSKSIADEFGFGNTREVDIKKLQNTIKLYNERKINKVQLKKMLWNIVKEEETQKYNYREID